MTTRPYPEQLATGTPEDGYVIKFVGGEIIWGEESGGGGGGETLEQTLVLGNTTGANWILVENGYGINSAVDGDSVRLQAGGSTSGSMLVSCGSNPAGNGGTLTMESGDSTSGGNGGTINILSGTSDDLGLGGYGGPINITTGIGDVNGGEIRIATGNGGMDGGSLYINGGIGAAGGGGNITLAGGQGALGGGLNMTAGDGVSNDGGQAYLGAGDSTNANGGGVYITAGSGPTGGGYAQLIAGDGLVAGDVTISAGLGDDGDYGDVLVRGDSINIDTTGSGTEFKFNDGYLAVLGDREVRWYGGDGHYSGLQAPATGTNNIWLLPEDDGSSGNVLTTDGSGALYWSVGGGGGGGGETLEQTLALGNTTGANWILVENDYGINSEVDGSGVRLLAGGATSGTMLISCGSNPAGAGGNLVIESGSSTSGGTGGGLDIRSGTSDDFGLGGIGGQIVMAAGAGEFAGGGILIAGGEGTGGVGTSGGDIVITAGDGYTSGGVFISGGVDNDGYYGNILMTGNNINIDTIGTGTEFKFNDGYFAALEEKEIRLYGADDHYSGLKASATGTNNTWTLPDDDGPDGYVLTTNGAGTLYWSAGGGTQIPFNITTVDGYGTLIVPVSVTDSPVMFQEIGASLIVKFVAYSQNSGIRANEIVAINRFWFNGVWNIISDNINLTVEGGNGFNVSVEQETSHTGAYFELEFSAENFLGQGEVRLSGYIQVITADFPV